MTLLHSSALPLYSTSISGKNSQDSTSTNKLILSFSFKIINNTVLFCYKSKKFFITKEVFDEWLSFSELSCKPDNTSVNSPIPLSIELQVKNLNHFVRDNKNLYQLTFNQTHTIFAHPENLRKSGTYFMNFLEGYSEAKRKKANIQILHTHQLEVFFLSPAFEIIKTYFTYKEPHKELQKIVSPEVLLDLYEFHNAMNISGIIRLVVESLNFFTNHQILIPRDFSGPYEDEPTTLKEEKVSVYNFVKWLAERYRDDSTKIYCDKHYEEILTIEKIIQAHPNSKGKFSFNSNSNIDLAISLESPFKNNEPFSEYCEKSLKILEELLQLENSRCDSITIDISLLSAKLLSQELISTKIQKCHNNIYLQEILRVISSYVQNLNKLDLDLVITQGNINLIPYSFFNYSNTEFEEVLSRISNQFKSISFTHFTCSDSEEDIPKLMAFYEILSIPGHSIEATYHYHSPTIFSSAKIQPQSEPQRSMHINYYNKNFKLDKFLPTRNFKNSSKGPIQLTIEQTTLETSPWLALGLENIVFSHLKIVRTLINFDFINQYRSYLKSTSTTSPFHVVHFENCVISQDAKPFCTELERNNSESEIWFRFNKNIHDLNSRLKEQGMFELACESLDDRKFRLNFRVNDFGNNDSMKLISECLFFLRKFPIEEQLNIHCIHIDMSQAITQSILEEGAPQDSNNNHSRSFYEKLRDPTFNDYKNKKLLISIPSNHIVSLELDQIELLINKFHSISFQIFGQINASTINEIYTTFVVLKQFDKVISLIDESESASFFQVTFSQAESSQTNRTQFNISSKGHLIQKQRLDPKIIINEESSLPYSLATSPLQLFHAQILKSKFNLFRT